jgi:aminoglycoside phosphotransferase
VNTVAAQLAARHEELDLAAFGVAERPACILLTPRFSTSRHVVALVLAEETGRPALVAKLPRLAGDGVALSREAAGLAAVRRALGETSSVPRLIAHFTDQQHPLLVETAIDGRPLSPAAIARDRDGSIEPAVAWLERVARTSARDTSREDDEARFRALIERPLQGLAAGDPADATLAALVERTLEALAPLRGARLPLVLEHGDTSHPNLLLRRFGDLAVVDWELADPDGMPGHDLGFFLVYAAGATRILHDAFFGADAWAWRWWGRYLSALDLDPQLGGRLWLASCARAVAVGAERGHGLRGAATVRQLPLWQHAMDHLDQLDHHGRSTS